MIYVVADGADASYGDRRYLAISSHFNAVSAVTIENLCFLKIWAELRSRRSSCFHRLKLLNFPFSPRSALNVTLVTISFFDHLILPVSLYPSLPFVSLLSESFSCSFQSIISFWTLVKFIF